MVAHKPLFSSQMCVMGRQGLEPGIKGMPASMASILIWIRYR